MVKENWFDVVRNGIRYFLTNGFRSTALRTVDFIQRDITQLCASTENVAWKSREAPIMLRRLSASMPKGVFDNDALLIIGDFGLPQCLKYRVLQKLEFLRSRNEVLYIASQFDSQRVMRLLQISSAVIFYRVHPSLDVLKYYDEANRLNLLKIYEVDDPIFDHAALASSQNVAVLPTTQRRAALESADKYLEFAKGFDALIGSTPGICERMEQLVGLDAHLWRNLVDSESISMMSAAKKNKTKKNVCIVYASGSTAHNADFLEVRNVLESVMLEKPELSLCIIGHCEGIEQFRRFGSRVRVEPFTSYGHYLELLAEGDIAIVPLTIDDFNQCKSAIRYLDASLSGIPSVATAVGDFINVITHGVNGMLCSNSDEWREAIYCLVNNEQLRSEIGLAAQRHVLARYSLSSCTQNGNVDNEILAKIFRSWKP